MREIVLPALLLLLISTLSAETYAAPPEMTPQEKVGVGLMHSLKNEKKEAWDILFPEAKAGNVDAMFHLGQMMVRSPEYPDNLGRAKQFFSAAAKKGHKGAAAMLLNVEKQIELKSGRSEPTIGGKSALPTPADIKSAKQNLLKQEQMTGRFVDDPNRPTPQATVHVFIGSEIEFADRVADTQVALESRYSGKVAFKYHIVIDQRTWQPSKSYRSNGEPRNMIGFEPDMNGVIAGSKGVRKTPAIVIETSRGSKKAVGSPDKINTELAGIIK